MSFTTMNQGGQQDGGYGGGKSAGSQPLYKSVTNELNKATSEMPGLSGQLANIVTRNAGNMVDNAFGYQGGPPPIDNDFSRGEMLNQYGIPGDPQRAQYQGGPPKLDLSGMMPTPEQRVAESQANGGILRMRQPRQPFNPNPLPNPGFGGGKGMIQPGGPGGINGGNPQMGLPYERIFDNNPQMRLPVERQYGNNPQMGLPVERQY